MRQITMSNLGRNGRLIPLFNSDLYTMVSEEDYDMASSYRWRIHKSRKRLYATFGKRVNGKMVMTSLHRMILNPPDGMFVDHINGDSLDNRRENLRVATPSQNMWNQGLISRNTSGIKGASYDKTMKMWRACIQKHGVMRKLGWFETKEEAGQAYAEAAKKLFGEFHNLG